MRNAIEGKFGQAKRRYSLNCVMSKLPSTSETSIAITFLVINLSTLLRQVYCLFMSLLLYPCKLGLRSDYSIVKADIKRYLTTEKLICWFADFGNESGINYRMREWVMRSGG